MGVSSAMATSPEEVDLPHHLYSKLQVQAFLDYLPERLLCLVLVLVHQQGIPDVVCILHTCELRDSCGAHLEGGDKGREGTNGKRGDRERREEENGRFVHMEGKDKGRKGGGKGEREICKHVLWCRIEGTSDSCSVTIEKRLMIKSACLLRVRNARQQRFL